MRILALARFRLLRTIRSAHWIFAVALVFAVFPMLVVDEIFITADDFWTKAREVMFSAAFMVHLTYMWHLIVIIAACLNFGTRRPAADGRESLDLTETVPATSADRFWGDAAGILASVLAIHLCVAPLLAFAIVLSPLPSATFFRLESLTVAIAVLLSAGASWNLHAKSKWSHTRLARSLAVFVALMIVILRFTTRWQSFADAWAFYFGQPSQASWRAIGRTITSPSMLLAGIALLYAGFIGYYAAQSVRQLERR